MGVRARAFEEANAGERDEWWERCAYYIEERPSRQMEIFEYIEIVCI